MQLAKSDALVAHWVALALQIHLSILEYDVTCSLSPVEPLIAQPIS